MGNHSEYFEECVLKAVCFGYEKSGLLSPTWDMGVRRFRGLQDVGNRPLSDYSPGTQRMLKLRTDDYLRWCRENGRTAVPASAEDVGAFLLRLAEQYSYAEVMKGSIAVWHLHREQGFENITKHPVVSEALTECRRLCDARKGQPRPRSPQVRAIRAGYERNWRSWCAGEGIDDVFEATPRDAVLYLESFDGSLSLDCRIMGLSDLYEGRDNPFASDEVACWRREYLARVPEMRAMRQAEEARRVEAPDPALEFTGRKLGDDWLKPGLTVEDRALVEQVLEPVYNLFRISTAKARTTICRLVLSFPSQFFHSRRALLQPGERPLHHPSFRQHHEGVQFVAFHHLHRGSQQVLHLRSKGLPGVAPVDHHILHPAQVGSALFKHRQSPGPVGNIGRGHMNRMGQPLAIHRDVALDPGHLLARVIALVLRAVGVLYALGVHDAEAGLLCPPIALPDRANRFFLRPAPEWTLPPGQGAHSIAGNTCSRCASRGSPLGASATGSRS